MHLGLNGWPPLASHVAVLLLGVSLANLSWHEAPTLSLPKRSLLLSLPPSAAAGLPQATVHGARVHLVHARGSASACRLSHDPMLLLERHPAPLVSARLADAAELAAVAQLVRLDTLLIQDAQAAASLPLCSAKPKVTYGTY